MTQQLEQMQNEKHAYDELVADLHQDLVQMEHIKSEAERIVNELNGKLAECVKLLEEEPGDI